MSRLRRRFAISLLLGAICVAAVVPIREGVSLRKHATSAQGEHLGLLTIRYGWPSKLVCYRELVVGSTERYRLASPAEARLLPVANLKTGWSVEWGNLGRLYGTVAGFWIVLLCGRVLYLYLEHRRRVAARSCGTCGYSKQGLPGPRCPECGTEHADQSN